MNTGEGDLKSVMLAGLVASVFVLAACDQKPSSGDATVQRTDKAAIQTKPAAEPAKSATGTPAPGTGKEKEGAELAARVKSALNAAPRLTGIDVVASDGVVTLYGTVDSNADRATAERMAAKVAGVKSVKNDLVVLKGS